METLHRQRQRGRHVVVQSREIRRNQELCLPAAFGQFPVGMHERRALRFAAIQREARLIQLYPRRTRGGQRAQRVGIDRQQRVEQRQPVERRALRLREQQKRDGSDEHGRRIDAEGFRFPELGDRFLRREPE